MRTYLRVYIPYEVVLCEGSYHVQFLSDLSEVRNELLNLISVQILLEGDFQNCYKDLQL